MGKKKAIKLATATAIAASAFVAVAPTQSEAATNSVDKAITKATKQMAKAYDTYHKAAKNDGVLPATGTIRNQAALAKDYYDKAKAEIAKNGGSKAKKAAYTKTLDSKKHFLDRAQAYVNAVNTNLKPSKSSFTKAVDAGKAKQVLAAQTVLNKDIARFEGKVAKIYGPDARNLLLKKYADPASKLADSVNDEMTVYTAYKQIENGFLIEKDIKKAKALMDGVEAEVKKLEAKNTKLAKNLLAAVKKNKDAYEKEKGLVSQVVAINTTTVEVTYKEAVKNVEAKDFSIEGLTVTNAVVKQTDSKVVVLTTSTQTGGKDYTIKSGDTELGSFKGISAVIPTAVKVTTPSIQGTIGKEVTVKATVTVPEGQSKAGIPVTVNIPKGNSLNEAITAEVYTNANGEASYSYTRYSAVNDNVVAYATGDRSVFSTANVYWANSLEVSEVTAGNTLANGSKKVYKIKTNDYNTDANGNRYVNVAFVENVNVTPDKLVRGVKVTDTGLSSADYPSQVTTGGVNEVRVKVDGKGEATFTLTGDNAAVTPVVFVDADKDGKWAASELQASAPKLSFVVSQTIGLDVKAEGVQNAAAISTQNTSTGGRNYTVTITSKDGKVAPAGTEAFVVFPQGSISTDKNVYIDGKKIVAGTSYPVTVAGSKGQVEFTLTGEKDGYATPTVYLNNGSSAGLDNSDLQKVGETTYFINAIVQAANLKVYSGTKEVTSVKAGETANFKYSSEDQNGFPYYVNPGNYQVTYEVTAQFADVTVSGNDLASTKIQKGTTKSVKVTAINGVANLLVDSSEATNVTVNASASQVSLPNKTASVAFTKYANATSVTGPVSAINFGTREFTVTEAGKTYEYNYGTGDYKIGGQEVTLAGFESKLSGSEVTVTKAADGKLTFNIIIVGTSYTFPVATVTDATREAGPSATSVPVKGNVTGTAYLVPENSSYKKEADLNTAVNDGFATKATITAAGTNTSIATAKLAAGKYKVVIVDAVKNVSKKSAGTVTITDTVAPTASSLDNTDVLTQGVYAATDTLTLTFSEAIDVSLTAGDLSVSDNHDLGTTATIVPVNPVNGQASIFTVTLGTTPTVVAGDTITIDKAKVIDAAGNVAAVNAVFTVNAAK